MVFLSHLPFGNDHAIDWALLLKQSKSLLPVETAFDRAISMNSTIPQENGALVIAAAEALAHIFQQGTQFDGHSEDVRIWATQCRETPSIELLEKSVQAIDLVTKPDSVLSNSWTADSKWIASVAAVRSPLQGILASMRAREAAFLTLEEINIFSTAAWIGATETAMAA